MAADILLYEATHVPVGNDQTQHLEFSRDLAIRMNSLIKSSGYEIPVPSPLGNDEKRVMSLQDGSKKMSKSDHSNKS